MQSKKKYCVGIDEAGRGPLAGPVTLALVRRAQNSSPHLFRGLKDSKHLTLKNREEWFLKFRRHPKIFCKATSVSHSVIDRLGISKAIKIGIARLLRKTPQAERSKVLLDGSLKAPLKYRQKTIIKGDENVPIIAAASVVAKIIRDRKMTRLAKRFPKYAFEIHKGYGTELHRKLIKKHGPSKIHRRSFLTKIL